MNRILSRLVREAAFLSLALAVSCVVCVGYIAYAEFASRDGLSVVHDAGRTVDAAPYLERPALFGGTGKQALDRAQARLAGAAPVEAPAFSPVRPGPLRAGPPSRLSIPGLTRPVFAVGCDPASLEWMESNAARLRDRGAQGFLVDAPSQAELSHVRAIAARLGLRLEPLPGAAFADAYGARSYPFVAEPPR